MPPVPPDRVPASPLPTPPSATRSDRVRCRVLSRSMVSVNKRAAAGGRPAAVRRGRARLMTTHDEPGGSLCRRRVSASSSIGTPASRSPWRMRLSARPACATKARLRRSLLPATSGWLQRRRLPPARYRRDLPRRNASATCANPRAAGSPDSSAASSNSLGMVQGRLVIAQACRVMNDRSQCASARSRAGASGAAASAVSSQRWSSASVCRWVQ